MRGAVRGACHDYDCRVCALHAIEERFLTRHALATYFLLTFAISWSSVLLVVGRMPGTADTVARMLPLAVLAMIAGPCSAAILLTSLLDGRAGWRNYRARLLRWRVSMRWYAAAILIAPFVTTAAIVALLPFSDLYRPGILTVPDPSRTWFSVSRSRWAACCWQC